MKLPSKSQEKSKKRYELKIPQAEIGYISLHILGSKMQQGFTIDHSEDIIDSSDDFVRDLAKEIIHLVGVVLSVDLQDDQQLLTGLILHLRPTINRLKYGLRLKNPLLNEIKLKYPSVFGAAWSSSVLFEKYYGIKVTEEEVAYLAMHFGAALERKKTLTRAVIVCSSGIGTAQLAAVRLEQSISDLKIVEITSYHDVSRIQTLDYDIIISTIPLRGYDKPVILINPPCWRSRRSKDPKVYSECYRKQNLPKQITGRTESRIVPQESDLSQAVFCRFGFRHSLSWQCLGSSGRSNKGIHPKLLGTRKDHPYLHWIRHRHTPWRTTLRHSAVDRNSKPRQTRQMGR